MSKRGKKKNQRKREPPPPLTFSYRHPIGARLRVKMDKNFDINDTPIAPLIMVKINGISVEALLDSGCTTLLIPRKLEKMLRLTYTGKTDVGQGVSGGFKQLETEIDLTIGNGPRSINIGRVKAWVPEDSDRDIPILIGNIPVFEKFTIMFDKANNKVIMTHNGHGNVDGT